MKSNLDLINECDAFPYYQVNAQLYLQHIATYYHLKVANCDATLGYLLPSVATVLQGLPDWELDEETHTLTLTGGSNAEERSAIVEKTVLGMRETGHFEVLKKWRGELYSVYGPDKELLFNMERSATPLFGVVTYGVHMTAYVRLGDTLKIWVPRRARGKQTYPGMLDNTVAGGISAGEKIFETLVRECDEEASLPEDVVRKGAKAAGAVTYFFIRTKSAGGETNLLQPECQYVYDLELSEDVTPKPNDDEVEQFYLWTVEEVKEAMRNGEFKPNTALVMLDFFIRHGVLTAETEKDYAEINARLHRRLEFPHL